MYEIPGILICWWVCEISGILMCQWVCEIPGVFNCQWLYEMSGVINLPVGVCRITNRSVIPYTELEQIANQSGIFEKSEVSQP